jgi:hypothetical protein
MDVVGDLIPPPSRGIWREIPKRELHGTPEHMARRALAIAMRREIGRLRLALTTGEAHDNLENSSVSMAVGEHSSQTKSQGAISVHF